MKRGERRKPAPYTHRRCMFPGGCTEIIPVRCIMCPKHWASVQPELRALLSASYCPGQGDTHRAHATYAAVAFLCLQDSTKRDESERAMIQGLAYGLADFLDRYGHGRIDCPSNHIGYDGNTRAETVQEAKDTIERER